MGALSVVDISTSPATIVKATLMPKIKRNTRSELDIYKVAEFISEFKTTIKFAVFEDVAAMPGQGVVSMFTFGKVTGVVLGVLGAHNIPIVFVKPFIWKLAYDLSSDKSLSFKKASELFPNNIDLWTKKAHEGIAEASILGHYGSRFF